jgi:uroporphyrinogen decarboxylase
LPGDILADGRRALTTRTENFHRLFAGGPPERLPFTFDVGAIQGFTEPLLERFQAETGSTNPAEHFDYDFRSVSLSCRFGGEDPLAFHAEVEAGTTFDEWGVGHWAGGERGTYERMYPPLAAAQTAADVHALPLPRIQPLETSSLLQSYRRRGYPVFGYAGSIYEWSWWLRGMQSFLEDLLLNPVLAEAVTHKVCAHTRALALASAQAGVDVLCFYDDAGMQTGLQLAPELWRRFIKPRWREVLESVRARFPACRFFLHSCGDVRLLLPDIVELGFHILHPVQPECMNIERVKRDFGGELVLCATLSAQRLLPFGTPAEVRKEVRRLRALFRDDGRGILCPSNRLQPETPWENVLAFAEEARGKPA